MAAYFIAHGTVTDQTKMSKYVEKSGPIFASFGLNLGRMSKPAISRWIYQTLPECEETSIWIV